MDRLLNNVTISETMSTNCSGLPNNCTGPVSIQCDACLFGRPNCEKKYLFSEKKIESVSVIVWKCPRNLITWAIWNESLTIINNQVFTVGTVEVETPILLICCNFYCLHGSKYWIMIIVEDFFSLAQVIYISRTFPNH